VLIFCGVLASPTALPGFWIFMYYLSPFTYLTSAMLSTGVANTHATCLDYEYLKFAPPSGQTCGQYMAKYIASVGGFLEFPNATDECSFCQVSDTNVFLNAVSARYADRWRNLGIMFAYIAFNIAAALFLYWLVRVPKKSKMTKEMSGPLTGRDVVEKDDKYDEHGRSQSPEVGLAGTSEKPSFQGSKEHLPGDAKVEDKF
jgi:ATP-binding cassette subfamily G (WHITE) protein 2 (PDR)